MALTGLLVPQGSYGAGGAGGYGASYPAAEAAEAGLSLDKSLSLCLDCMEVQLVKQELATGPRVLATKVRANLLSALVPRTRAAARAEPSSKGAEAREAWSKGAQPSKATSSSASQSSSSASGGGGGGADLKSEVAPSISSPDAACIAGLRAGAL